VKSILASRFRNLLLLAVAVPLCLGGLSAKANLLTTFPEMGDLLRWGAFSLGGGVSTTDTIDDFVGTTDIYGDVGVAGDGNITMTGNATIHGDLYYHQPGKLTLKGNASITGATHHDAASDSMLDNGVTEAMNTAAHAFALPATRPNMNIQLSGNQNLTLTGAPGETVVLKLTNFIITSGTLTLQGSANTNFVINVSNQFSLTSHAQIILSGGVSWDDVLFNVVGNGSTATLSGQSTLNGVLMATNRTVDLSGGSTVNGEVVANKITMSGSSKIVHPPLSSP
jgi:Ice-binding-like